MGRSQRRVGVRGAGGPQTRASRLAPVALGPTPRRPTALSTPALPFGHGNAMAASSPAQTPLKSIAGRFGHLKYSPRPARPSSPLGIATEVVAAGSGGDSSQRQFASPSMTDAKPIKGARAAADQIPFFATPAPGAVKVENTESPSKCVPIRRGTGGAQASSSPQVDDLPFPDLQEQLLLSERGRVVIGQKAQGHTDRVCKGRGRRPRRRRRLHS